MVVRGLELSQGQSPSAATCTPVIRNNRSELAFFAISVTSDARTGRRSVRSPGATSPTRWTTRWAFTYHTDCAPQKRSTCSKVGSCGHRLETILVVQAVENRFGDDTWPVACRNSILRAAHVALVQPTAIPPRHGQHVRGRKLFRRRRIIRRRVGCVHSYPARSPPAPAHVSRAARVVRPIERVAIICGAQRNGWLGGSAGFDPVQQKCNAVTASGRAMR